MKQLLRAIALLFAVTAAAAPAASQGFGARNAAMGGVGVASSRHVSAGFTNPALLAHARDNDHFGLSLPYFRITAADEDELIDAIDEFQDTLTQVQDFLDMGDTASADALRPTLAAQLQALDGRELQALVDAGFGVSIPGDGLSMAVVGRTMVDGVASPVIDPNDVTVIQDNSSTSADLDNLNSEATFVAAGITEVGVAVAASVNLLGISLSVGATPKVQRVETFNYAVTVQSFEDDDALDDFSDSGFRSDDSFFNIDLGVAAEPLPGVTVGVMARDLISQEVDSVVTGGRVFTVEIEPRLTAGVALSGSGFTLAADVDVFDNERFSSIDGTQILRVGGEYDLGGWIQLRGGYITDLEETRPDLFTGGVGLSPFDTVHLDVVGMLGDNSAGVGLELSFTL